MRRLCRLAAGVLGLLAAVSYAVAAEAAGITYRNDIRVPVVVQGASVVNNVVRRGKPHLLYPGETAFDPIVLPGAKRITIYDPRPPNRVLFTGAVPSTEVNLTMSILMETVTASDSKETTLKVNLVPVKPAAQRK